MAGSLVKACGASVAKQEPDGDLRELDWGVLNPPGVKSELVLCPRAVDVQSAVQASNWRREECGQLAGPHGLSVLDVFYKEDINLMGQSGRSQY